MFPDFTRCYASRGKLSHSIFKQMWWWIGLSVLLKLLWFSQCLKRDSRCPDTVTVLLDHPRVAMCHTSLSPCSLLGQIQQPTLPSRSFYHPVLEFLRRPINEAGMIARKQMFSTYPSYFSLYKCLGKKNLNTEKYKEKKSNNYPISTCLELTTIICHIDFQSFLWFSNNKSLLLI